MNKTEKIDLSTLKIDTNVNTAPKKTTIQIQSFQQFSRVTLFANEMRSVQQLNVILRYYTLLIQPLFRIQIKFSNLMT